MGCSAAPRVESTPDVTEVMVLVSSAVGTSGAGSRSSRVRLPGVPRLVSSVPTSVPTAALLLPTVYVRG
ncbi:hypothetical protein Ddep01_03313 [Deinococcus depolymerans]